MMLWIYPLNAGKQGCTRLNYQVVITELFCYDNWLDDGSLTSGKQFVIS
jgi:hypothetical protein